MYILFSDMRYIPRIRMICIHVLDGFIHSSRIESVIKPSYHFSYLLLHKSFVYFIMH